MKDAHLLFRYFVIDLVQVSRQCQLTDSDLIDFRRHIREYKAGDLILPYSSVTH